MRAARRAWRRLAALALLALLPATALAQEQARVVEGRVVRPLGERTAGVGGAWVVLHRVARDGAGPLDSMRTSANGDYAIRYRTTGDTNAVYFVSTNRGGVAYFTSPLREARVRGDAAQLLVFDTTSAPIPITVRGRHVIVLAPDTAATRERTVIEVYELSNDTTITRVASAGGTTFDAPLPPGVTAVQGGEGDVSADALAVEWGRVRVNAPIAPGLKQFSFLYRVPASGEALYFEVESAVPAVEVLIEDHAGSATGAGLVAVTPVDVEGRRLKRFLAQDVAAGARFEVVTPVDTRGLKLMLVVTAIGTALLLALGMLFLRRGPAAFARRSAVDPETLAARIATLDATFERIASPTDEQRGKHLLERAHLRGRLAALLAKRDGLS